VQLLARHDLRAEPREALHREVRHPKARGERQGHGPQPGPSGGDCALVGGHLWHVEITYPKTKVGYLDGTYRWVFDDEVTGI